jgi:hypothetical protein
MNLSVLDFESVPGLREFMPPGRSIELREIVEFVAWDVLRRIGKLGV